MSYLSLLRKISCRMPISRSLWVSFSLLLAPGLTRLPASVSGLGGVQGTLSSMVSWESRRAISNVCRSIMSSRLAASPKSLILFTLTMNCKEKWNNIIIIFLWRAIPFMRPSFAEETRRMWPIWLTSLCLIQIKVEIVFKLLLLSPVNCLLLLSLLGQAFLFSTWFCQSIGLLSYKQQETKKTVRIH